MGAVAQKSMFKFTQIAGIEIPGKGLNETITKNWLMPGIDGIQNYWWKKFIGARKSVVKCMNNWIEDPEKMYKWITDGRTVLLPKTEN